MGDEGEKTCPLCAEEMDLTDQQLKPCKCGYEVTTSISSYFDALNCQKLKVSGIHTVPQLSIVPLFELYGIQHPMPLMQKV